MIKYKIENVTTIEQLDKLYNNSAFTIEGLAEESIPDLLAWLNENTSFTKEEPTVYITKGNIMNEYYYLEGNNAYSNDLTIVSIVDINPMNIVTKRFSIGGRWFDDVVDNNVRRQN